jgi:hypothetical protein
MYQSKGGQLLLEAMAKHFECLKTKKKKKKKKKQTKKQKRQDTTHAIKSHNKILHLSYAALPCQNCNSLEYIE